LILIATYFNFKALKAGGYGFNMGFDGFQPAAPPHGNSRVAPLERVAALLAKRVDALDTRHRDRCGLPPRRV
jgi:hypothetical protein